MTRPDPSERPEHAASGQPVPGPSSQPQSGTTEEVVESPLGGTMHGPSGEVQQRRDPREETGDAPPSGRG